MSPVSDGDRSHLLAPAGARPISLEPRETRADRIQKKAVLRNLLAEMGSTLVAYSGGVDSAYLLAEAAGVLGARALGIIGKSPSLPQAELSAALALADSHGLPVRVVETGEMKREEYRTNRPDRCYHCKAELFDRLSAIAAGEGWRTLAYGAVTDDLGDVRPGMAAARDFGVRAPLLESGLGKVDVRALARDAGLAVWDKPQSPCLASRIPHGSVVSEAKLAQVDRGEAWLKGTFGLRVVRLRHEGERARIEVLPQDVARLADPATLHCILMELNKLGFSHVEIDPDGYRRLDPLPTTHWESP